ncbi:MAG: hypothetical protein EOO90_19225 [Pedobacter sp.]|nr:MAG: hypothetical protein EOO90_19225 [Pedobacter sp.]
MELARFILKLLTFKMTKQEMLTFNNKHLITGVAGTWIVGMGRYWDDPKASLLQHLGLGSVIYIFCLAAFIWLILLPFKINNWSYRIVLTFIALTSFPAIFYAIPVEQFYSIQTSNTINVWFLVIVALWRLCLLYYFLKHFTRLSDRAIMIVTLMPMCLIISVLTILNLQNAVFAVMGGLRNSTPHDASYAILNLLTFLSVLFAIPLLIAYGLGIYYRHKEIKKKLT